MIVSSSFCCIFCNTGKTKIRLESRHDRDRYHHRCERCEDGEAVPRLAPVLVDRSGRAAWFELLHIRHVDAKHDDVVRFALKVFHLVAQQSFGAEA